MQMSCAMNSCRRVMAFSSVGHREADLERDSGVLRKEIPVFGGKLMQGNGQVKTKRLAR